MEKRKPHKCSNRFGEKPHDSQKKQTPRNKTAKFCFCQRELDDLIYVGLWSIYRHQNLHIQLRGAWMGFKRSAVSYIRLRTKWLLYFSLLCVIDSAGVCSYDSLMRASKLKLTHYVWWLRRGSSHQSIASVTQWGKSIAHFFFLLQICLQTDCGAQALSLFTSSELGEGETKFEVLNFESPESRPWDCKKFQERASSLKTGAVELNLYFCKLPKKGEKKNTPTIGFWLTQTAINPLSIRKVTRTFIWMQQRTSLQFCQANCIDSVWLCLSILSF